MSKEITNKDYIEITADGVTVGGKSTTTYHGQKIWWSKNLSNDFNKKIQQVIQREYGAAPIAMRAMSSETNGEYARPGNPSPKHGKNAWVSFVFANGVETDWVFRYSFSSASDCAVYCAHDCERSIRGDSGFRSGVFGPVADKIKALESPAPVSCNKVTQYKADEIRDICVGNQILRVKILSVKNKTL